MKKLICFAGLFAGIAQAAPHFDLTRTPVQLSVELQGMYHNRGLILKKDSGTEGVVHEAVSREGNTEVSTRKLTAAKFASLYQEFNAFFAPLEKKIAVTYPQCAQRIEVRIEKAGKVKTQAFLCTDDMSRADKKLFKKWYVKARAHG